MPKISIIVPVYKVEKYLDKCVKSILAQTFKDFELILVDDGSPDNCGKMCDDYAKQDNRIVVLHKENGGLSDARNAGIGIAKGQYLGFVDSDDYIAPDMYEILHNCLVENNADVAVCGLYNCFKNKKVSQYKKKEFYLLDNVSALKMALEGVVFSVHAVNKLYKRDLFNKNSFPEGKLSEDAFIIPKILFESKKVVVKTLPLYYYEHHSGTITTSQYKEKDLDVINAYFENLKFVEMNCPELKKQAEFRFLWSHMYVLDKMLLSKNFKDINKLNEIVHFLRKNTLKVLMNPCFNKKRKLATIILFFNKSLYEKIMIKDRKNNMELNS